MLLYALWAATRMIAANDDVWRWVYAPRVEWIDAPCASRPPNIETLQQLRLQKQLVALHTAACLDSALAGVALWAGHLLGGYMQQEGFTDRYCRRWSARCIEPQKCCKRDCLAIT